MNPVRQQRLYMVIFVVVFASLAVALMTFALKENINLFYPPSKIVAGEAPLDKSIKAGGCVLPGSVIRASDSLKVNFEITDGIAKVPVVYTGILPDLFSEGEAAVITGKLDASGLLNADQVLAKHDENYTPPEVADAVAAAEGAEHQKTCEGLSYDS